MRIACVADCHLGQHAVLGGPVSAGLNRRARHTVDVLSRAVITADAYDCDLFIVAGDLFDTVRPNPQLIRATQEALRSHVDANPPRVNGTMRVSLLVGNHDLNSTALGDHALGPLQRTGDPLIRVVDRTNSFEYGVGNVRFAPFTPKIREQLLTDSLSRFQSSTHATVLVTHVGLEVDSTPPWLKGSADSVPVDQLAAQCKYTGAPLVLAGNWHPWADYEVDGVKLMQVGALCPTGFDDAGLDYGHMVIAEVHSTDGAWETKRVQIPGPRFLKLPSARVAGSTALITKESGNVLYVRVETTPERLVEERELLDALVKDGALVAGEVIAIEDECTLQQAAREARPDLTLDGALAEWFADTDGKALQRARSYLAAA